MASEMSKDVKFSEVEVTSHPRVLEGEDQTVVPARQSSIFALTSDELQYSVCEAGRNFGSMNMDEFMSNIWNAKEFQAATSGVLVGMEVDPVVGAGRGGGGEDARGTNLAWQESFSLPPQLCQETVEEVWTEINREPRPVHSRPQSARRFPSSHWREMVVRLRRTTSGTMNRMTQVDMMKFIGDGAMMENGGARKRGASEDQSCERSIERSHHRMIKNPESAGQLRARKQVLTWLPKILALCNAIFAMVVNCNKVGYTFPFFPF
nr:ABI5-D63 [Triticum aestivum]